MEGKDILTAETQRAQRRTLNHEDHKDHIDSNVRICRRKRAPLHLTWTSASRVGLWDTAADNCSLGVLRVSAVKN